MSKSEQHSVLKQYPVAIFGVLFPVSLLIIAGTIYILFFQKEKVLTTPPPSYVSRTDEKAHFEPREEEHVSVDIVEEEVLPEPDDVPLVPLPLLHESDIPFLDKIESMVNSAALRALLYDDQIVRKLVRAVHALSDGHVVKEYRPLRSPKGLMDVSELPERDASNQRLYALNSASYQRYTAYIQALTAVSPEAIADMYVRYYPLFQQAYDELGMKDTSFHQVVLRALDNAVAPQSIPVSARLMQPSVVYVFESKDIEALSSLQKLRWRMGAQHSERLDTWLSALHMKIEATESLLARPSSETP